MVGNCILAEERTTTKTVHRRRHGKRRPKGPGINSLILGDIQKIITGRKNEDRFCDDDEVTYFDAALPLVVFQAIDRGRQPDVMAWARRWTPGLANDNDPVWFERQALEIRLDNHSLRTVDQTAALLGLVNAEVLRFELKALPGIDRPKQVRQAEDRERRRVREKARRRANGATPREASRSALQPWKAAGISRATWYRRARSGEIPAAVEGPAGAGETIPCLTVVDATGGARSRLTEGGAGSGTSGPPVVTDATHRPADDIAQVETTEPDEVAAPPEAVNDRAAPPAPGGIAPVTSGDGFQGAALRLSACEVESYVRQFPHLADDMDRHLAEIDRRMVRYRTLDHAKLRVLLNNLRDMNFKAARSGRRDEGREAA